MAQECPVMTSPLSLYLANNHSPSDEEAIKAKELKQIPSAKLAKVEDLILQTQHKLDALYEERNALKSSIARCNTILSPIRRVPQDVWREIFFHCLATHRNPIMSYTEAPLLLTHICNLWRSIALSTPQIWSRIYIPIFHTIRDPIFDLPPTHVDHPEVFAVTDKIQQRCDLVPDWLGRAGVIPLSIALSNQSGAAPPTDLHHQLLDNIFLCSSRLQKLDLMTITMGEVHNRAFNLSVDQVPNLEDLRIFSIRNDRRHWYEHGIFKAPKLRKLSIGFLPGSGRPTTMFPIPSNWSKLTHLYIGSLIHANWASQLLLHCPLLMHCNIKVKHAIPNSATDETHNLREINLPNLTHFGITEDRNDGASIYSVMYAPVLRNLEWFQIRLRHAVLDPFSIFQLLPRLESLNKFTFDPDVLTLDDALDCFRLVPSISHLRVGRKVDNLPFRTFSPKKNVIELLLPIPQEYPDQSLFLLPKLEKLEIYGVSISDKDLLDFIVTRLEHQQPGVSRLRYLRGRFTRVKQMDISRQVEYHAKNVGVEFQLDLSWPVQDLEAGLSPSMGNSLS
ncbi:hypothetical protein GALMADRAFT_246324 [Galerina marginata CBS 339.88]|uniref:F-box domain-containing protein n=1 Tax=Galerina marginata (strain CBS 339.88) TaxID=685588 RepID=A0A067TB56_GALM3|nr:hypothetical protein GALMADRAFT_246324 [Galerina marginata CBS 339.88]